MQAHAVLGRDPPLLHAGRRVADERIGEEDQPVDHAGAPDERRRRHDRPDDAGTAPRPLAHYRALPSGRAR
jgi:hypothetical protein